MKTNKIVSLLSGLVFIIALTTYVLTLEPTTSFWDCSEFIACAHKLEVGHAPGAPVFMLVGRFFSLFAGNNSQWVAFSINMVSAVLSALTVLLLFLTIVWFIKKMVSKDQKNRLLLIYGSAFIGALTFAFTDSFWFSAVEGEVYATSAFFSALVFWLILKWEQSENSWQANRYIVLIFFLLGLSVGVHLLNLLALPAMALVVYYKKRKPSTKGMVLTLAGSMLLLLFMVFLLIPGVAKAAAYSDLFFVNTLHLPVYSGAIIFIALLSAGLVYATQYFYRKGKATQYLVTLCFSFWLIGYSSFAVLVIRSAKNPFIDINNVENIFGLVDYLNREQYPKRPLIYGNNYNSPIVDVKKRYNYKLYNNKYYKDELNPKYSFHKKTLTLFPRMASLDKRYAEAYQQWITIKGRKVSVTGPDGKPQVLTVPTFGDNLRFFFKYQLGHMYLRYLMWNFSGKQNDIQGHGNSLDGNWLTGINFIDNWRLGSQDAWPDYYKNHKARNNYYLIPFLVGLLGLYFIYKKYRAGFNISLLLFLLTGVAIVVYLNEIPITPRERDYAYAGSYYVFALWIGLGVFFMLDALSHSMNKKWAVVTGLLVIGGALPGNMFIQNYDDHNRSNRFTARDYAKNMLNSCAPDALLFTTADNDTYPIWYLQEAEHFRADVRNILLPFLPADWYASQLTINHPAQGKVTTQFEGTDLLMSNNQYFPVVNKTDTFIEVKRLMEFVRSDDKRAKLQNAQGDSFNYVPGKKLKLSVNRNAFTQNCSFLPHTVEVPMAIEFELKKKYLGRQDVLLLDILAQNNWERPVYFVYPHLVDELGLSEYLHREGMLYRLLPYKKLPYALKQEFALHQFKLLNEEFVWGNVNNPDVYLDHTNIQIIQNFRLRPMFAEVANLLSAVDENRKAEQLIDKACQLFPPQRVPYSYFMPELVASYEKAEAIEKARKLKNSIETQAYGYLQAIEKMDTRYKQGVGQLNNEWRYILYQLSGSVKNE